MSPLNRIGKGCCSMIAFFGLRDFFELGVVMPSADTSSNLGLASLSAGVC